MAEPFAPKTLADAMSAGIVPVTNGYVPVGPRMESVSPLAPRENIETVNTSPRCQLP